MGYVVGVLVAMLGGSMIFPMGVDLYYGNDHWDVFIQSGVVTVLPGALLALSCANADRSRLDRRQIFLITTCVWLVLPIFGSLPFVAGATDARLVDGFFESMSGLTTTGSTVFSNLEELPQGLLFWRGLLQWFGGIGIIVVAMVFLPELRIGGMQIFRSAGIDAFDKILPRTGEVAVRIFLIYSGLTVICMVAYTTFGMEPFDAVVHSMTTLATGGFSNYDASFGVYGPAVHYCAVFFMIAAALPFLRYVQLLKAPAVGSIRDYGPRRPFTRYVKLLSEYAGPLRNDGQIRAFLIIVVVVALMIAVYVETNRDLATDVGLERTIFNTVSIITGTGYANDDYMAWGSFPLVVLFFAGLIGGCAGSTSCSVKVFRYQLLFGAIRAQVLRIHVPHGIFEPRYGGRAVGEDVINSVMAFFSLFVVTLGVLTVLLALTGLDLITSLSGAAAAVANIGPGLGDQIGPAGNFAGLNDTAKWLLSAGMLIGRLELMAVYVLLTVNFWRE